MDDLDAAVAHPRAWPGVRLLREPDTRGNKRRAFVLTPRGAAVQLITPRIGIVF